MDSNTGSISGPRPGGLEPLASAIAALAAEDLHALPAGEAAARVLALRGLLERLEGQWLRELAAVDARGAAGAEAGTQAPSTAAWLRGRLRAGGATASGWVRMARALFRGPLSGTAHALAAGDISVTHAGVLAGGTQDLPPGTTAAAEPVLLDAAHRLDPPRLRQVVADLHQVLDPDAADAQAQRQHQRRGLWVAPTLAGMVAVDGLLDPEAGRDAAGRHGAADPPQHRRRPTQRVAAARRRVGRAGPPRAGGRPAPQHRRGAPPAHRHRGAGQPARPHWQARRRRRLGGAAGRRDRRRLACDAALTRVLVTRDPHDRRHRGPHHQPAREEGDGGAAQGLAARLRAAVALLPPALGGAPTQPLEVGRATRVVSAAQRAALAVRDGGCRFPGCDRPPAWCEAHHLRHWLHGGATDLANLVLLCRAHHRAVHEGGQRLHPPHRQQPTAA